MYRIGQKLFLRTASRLCSLVFIAIVFAFAPKLCATENGASVFPIGVETVMTGMQPHPGNTMVYEYTCYYVANQFDGSNGKPSIPEFKLRVFATAIKLNHNWGLKFMGGTIDSQIAVPLVYQQLHVPPGKFSKYAIGNTDLIPFSVTTVKGNLHYYYEADLFAPGSAYSPSDVLNIGQHNLAVAPVAGFTYLGDHGKSEISSRFSYIFNGPDSATKYHSGNEFMWEFNVDREIHRGIAVGFNGFLYKQTTNDRQSGFRVGDGFRGRELAVGPQVRFPLGKHGGYAFKYFRDTLVRNKPRGNAFWFQIAIPIQYAAPHAEQHSK